MDGKVRGTPKGPCGTVWWCGAGVPRGIGAERRDARGVSAGKPQGNRRSGGEGSLGQGNFRNFYTFLNIFLITVLRYVLNQLT